MRMGRSDVDENGYARARQRLAMLKRLGAYPRQNGLALALREIGRIERTFSPWTGWNSRNFVDRLRRS